jgi:hypothetical protein
VVNILIRLFKTVISAGIIAASFSIGGCAIHPLTDDIISARMDTVSIVRHIRCEARAAFVLAIADYFQNHEQFDVGSPTDLVGARIRSGEITTQTLNSHLKEVDKQAAANVLNYEDVAIGYDFSFDMTEDNGYTAQVDLLQVLTGGSTGLGLKAGGDFQRQTVRIFRVSDTFRGLFKLDDIDCPPDDSVDFAHPVRGNIGISEMVKTFIQLNVSEHLVGPKDAEKVPVLSDTFNFQTTLSGSASPAITLSPVGHRYGLADANIAASGSRKDIHKVIVAMSLPIKPGQREVGGAVGVGLVGTPRVIPPRSAGERVNRALDDQINRSILNQLSTPIR